MNSTNDKKEAKNILLAALEKKKQKQSGYGSTSSGPLNAKGKKSKGQTNASSSSSLGHRPTGR